GSLRLGGAQLAIRLLALLQGRSFVFRACGVHTRIELAAFRIPFGLFCVGRRALARCFFFFLLTLPLELVQLARMLLGALTRGFLIGRGRSRIGFDVAYRLGTGGAGGIGVRDLAFRRFATLDLLGECGRRTKSDCRGQRGQRACAQGHLRWQSNEYSSWARRKASSEVDRMFGLSPSRSRLAYSTRRDSSEHSRRDASICSSSWRASCAASLAPGLCAIWPASFASRGAGLPLPLPVSVVTTGGASSSLRATLLSVGHAASL